MSTPEWIILVVVSLVNFIFLLARIGLNHGPHSQSSSKAKPRKSASRTRKEVPVTTLIEEYRRLWPGLHFVYEPSSVDNSIEDRGQLEDQQLTAVQQLLSGKHLLLQDCTLSSLNRVLFPALISMLLDHKKLILIVSHEEELTLGAEWFAQGMSDAGAPAFAWTAASLTDALERNLNVDLLLVKASELLEDRLKAYLRQERENDQSDFVVLMAEGSKLLAQHALSLTVFANRIAHVCGGPPQYAIVSEWAEGLEEAVQAIFNVVPEAMTFSPGTDVAFHYSIVTMSGERLQQPIMPRLVHRELEPETVLALPALKFGMERIAILYEELASVRESQRELRENLAHAAADYGVSHELLSTGVELQRRSWANSPSPYGLVINRDSSCNVIACIEAGVREVNENSLVIVVSPSYLLRDYLEANADFYLQNNRIIAPIVAVPSANGRTAYSVLMDRLSLGWMDAEEIDFERIGMTWSSLDVRLHRRYDYSIGKYIEATQVRLNPEQAERWRMKAECWVAELSSGGFVAELSGEVWQRYWPGQQAAFGGRLYRVLRIDEQRKRIELTPEPQESLYQYEQSRTYSLHSDRTGQPISDPVRWTSGRFEWVLRCEYRGFDVRTNGYYQYKLGADPIGDQALFVPICDDEPGARRTYSQGRVLCVTLNSLDAELEDTDNLAYMLSCLLNGVFATFYPYHHPYLHANAAPAPDKERSFQLYVFEDSGEELGLVESIARHWGRFLEVLDDYAAWAVDHDRGTDGPARGLELEPLENLLNRLLPQPSLRTLREQAAKLYEQDAS